MEKCFEKYALNGMYVSVEKSGKRKKLHTHHSQITQRKKNKIEESAKNKREVTEKEWESKTENVYVRS